MPVNQLLEQRSQQPLGHRDRVSLRFSRRQDKQVESFAFGHCVRQLRFGRELLKREEHVRGELACHFRDQTFRKDAPRFKRNSTLAALALVAVMLGVVLAAPIVPSLSSVATPTSFARVSLLCFGCRALLTAPRGQEQEESAEPAQASANGEKGVAACQRV
jgi:hypothetical protein